MSCEWSAWTPAHAIAPTGGTVNEEIGKTANQDGLRECIKE